MFYLVIKVDIDGPSTFMMYPWDLTNVSSYHFIPPTTFSGYLARILLASQNDYDRIPFRQNGPNSTPLYLQTLFKDVHVLGAFPVGSFFSHISYRHGMQNIQHTRFSQIISLNPRSEMENFQLYHWEYCFFNSLNGYILSEDEKDLTKMSILENYGWKLGKEGYGRIASVEGPFKLVNGILKATPSTIIPFDKSFIDLKEEFEYDLLKIYYIPEKNTLFNNFDPRNLSVNTLNVAIIKSGTIPSDYFYNEQNCVYFPASLLTYF